jgi:carboxyl-terminal processing protease
MNEQNEQSRSGRRHLGLVFAGLLALGWLVGVGCASSHKEPDLQLIGEAWNKIQKDYVGREALQPKELTYGAIAGMVDALGDTGHSTFLTPEMVKELKNVERGEFKGIGIEIQMKNDHVVVVAPLDGSPAQRAGIRAGDFILKVNGRDVSDWPLSRVVERIAGRAGTRVSLTLQDPHSNRTRRVTIVRASIKLHQVTWERLPGTSIVHLRLATFDAGVTKDMKQALTQILQQNTSGVVLDLRDNPGGLLEEAISTASQFLGDGNVLVAKNAKGETEPVPVEKGGMATNVPVVVLVNEGSASAAEIVAGALQDAHRAELVGGTTFGTGTVLEEFKLGDGSALLLAVEEWLTPSGRSFWHKGLVPDIPVRLPTDANPLFPSGERELDAAQLQRSDDRQLLAALRVVRNVAQTQQHESVDAARAEHTDEHQRIAR